MALVTENGTGLATAESYASVADASTRHAALGNTNWATLTATEMEQALRRATVHMGQSYRTRWTGVRLNSTQALDWPRSGVFADGYSVASDIVPVDVKNACIDLALKAASGELNPDLERAVIREKVGPLETEYSAASPQQVRYRAIDMALAAYLTGGGSSNRIVRT